VSFVVSPAGFVNLSIHRKHLTPSTATSVVDGYLYIAPDLRHVARVPAGSLAQMTERHHAELTASSLLPVADLSAELSQPSASGVVFELASGLPSEQHLRLISQVLQAGRQAWMYWPAEEAIECVDGERLRSLRRHGTAVKWLKRIAVPIDRAVTTWQRAPTGLRWIYRGEFPVRRSDILVKLTLLSLRAQPVSVDPLQRLDCIRRFAGVGVYLRADYWTTGRSDDRMSRVVAELMDVSERVVCLTPWRDRLLDRLGVQQIVMDAPRLTSGEDAIVLAPAHYGTIVKAVCQALHPTYLYDRLCAGQSVGAELSQVLDIPYIVEYPGAETLLREALGGAAAFYPELYAKAEELALRQATIVVVGSTELKAELASRGIDAAKVLVVPREADLGVQLQAHVEAHADRAGRAGRMTTGDPYKDEAQHQWNQNPVGSQHARVSQPRTLEWFREIERHRYGVYAPWMPEAMEFADHAGDDVLEIGSGIGTDLAQFARHGASVTDVDLAATHLQLAEENFRLRGLRGRFIHHDAESLPFSDHSFDLVYSNGVLHHTPNTALVVGEIYRVLRPGGRAIVMVYAENSWHYWRKLVWRFGVKERLLDKVSMGDIMSRSVERSANEARPLVKVYTRSRARALFKDFARVDILQRQLLAEELPAMLRWTLPLAERILGWNLIVKAVKPC
jgi:ubiquinone/menaquinone biosynthesis C-methylase UbiE